jgi:taurine dioxygenase
MKVLEKTEVEVVNDGRPVGAEIRGVDLKLELGVETVRQIREALNKFGVIFFRDQDLRPEDQVRFTGLFGEPEKHILHEQYGLKGHPEVLLIGNVTENGRYIGVNDGGLKWHTDLSYKQEPTLYSFLYAVEVPQTDGQPLGDTVFASTAFAYETLPASKKHRIDGLKAVHGYSHQFNERLKKKREMGEERQGLTKEQIALVPEVVHPVVRTHPITRRKCIYVNEWFTTGIVGMPEVEGRELLRELCSHCTRDEFVYRHKWQVGDLLVWDNPQTQHIATFDFGPHQRRLMRRTIVKGTAPF